MGYRLIDYIGMLPASIESGILHVYEDIIPPITLPDIYKSVSFPVQCNVIDNSSIKCYLKSDKYEFVMWNDGTITIYTAGTRYPISIDYNVIGESEDFYCKTRCIRAGLLSESFNFAHDAGGDAYLFISDDNRAILFAENCRLVAVGVKQDSFFYHYCKTNKIEVSPTIIYRDLRLKCDAYGKKFEVECDNIINTEPAVTLKGVI